MHQPVLLMHISGSNMLRYVLSHPVLPLVALISGLETRLRSYDFHMSED